MAALGLGFAVTPTARSLLCGRYVVYRAVLFAVLAAPDVVWQALHGWPNFAVFDHLNQQARQNRALYWPIQVVYTSIALVPLWVGGIAWALRDPRPRVVGVAAVAVILAQFVLGGKGYYPGGVYTSCFAYDALPASERAVAAIVAGNYGEADAVDRYGAALGLPPVYRATAWPSFRDYS